jgi:hypothetical protein
MATMISSTSSLSSSGSFPTRRTYNFQDNASKWWKWPQVPRT